jgi:hypothetical protein
MFKAHRYYNVLIEIEHARRLAVRTAMSSHADLVPLEAELEKLVAEQDAARTAIKAGRKATRSKSESAEQRQAVRTLGERVKELRRLTKAARTAVREDPEIAAKIEAANEEAKVKCKQARAACGVYWGTYLLKEQAADAARKSVTPPRFGRWTGEAKVSVQIQHGLSLDRLFSGGSQQIQIDPVPEEAFLIRGARRRARACLTNLRMRVASEDGKPVWAHWRIWLHRPLPDGALVKVATVSRRNVHCSRQQWVMHMTVDTSACKQRVRPDGGVLALNLGYCLTEEGFIRSGYAVGDDSHEQEILVVKSDYYRTDHVRPDGIPNPGRGVKQNYIVNGLGKSASIEGFRDKNLNEFLATIGPWRETMASAGKLPEWFVERTKTIHAWRSQRRLYALHTVWGKQRFDGDQAGWDVLVAWRARDAHLDAYQAALRISSLRDRREGYRILASRMAKRYRTLIIDDFDLRTFIRTPAAESERPNVEVYRKQQFTAACSELRQVFANAFGAENVVKLSSKDVSRLCPCGNIVEVSPARIQVCGACGISWDQDANACRNLLRMHAAQGAGPAKDEKKPSRSQRLRSNKRKGKGDAQASEATQ